MKSLIGPERVPDATPEQHERFTRYTNPHLMVNTARGEEGIAALCYNDAVHELLLDALDIAGRDPEFRKRIKAVLTEAVREQQAL
jgi:hypothetical protein